MTRDTTTPAPTPSPGAAGTATGLDELTLTELVLPEQANHYGTLFGPYAMALLGKAAFLVATRATRRTIVMASAGGIKFLRPIPVGSVLMITARVVRTGRTSLTVHVSGRFDVALDPTAAEVLRGEFEMVAVDARGRPTPIAADPAA